jgi:hypothetical protein
MLLLLLLLLLLLWDLGSARSNAFSCSHSLLLLLLFADISTRGAGARAASSGRDRAAIPPGKTDAA